MATPQECEQALQALGSALTGLDASMRSDRVPSRSVSFTVPDLDTTWRGRLDGDGLHDLSTDAVGKSQLRIEVASDELVALSKVPQDFLGAWMRGRVKIRASPKDLLQLRRLI